MHNQIELEPDEDVEDIAAHADSVLSFSALSPSDVCTRVRTRRSLKSTMSQFHIMPDGVVLTYVTY